MLQCEPGRECLSVNRQCRKIPALPSPAEVRRACAEATFPTAILLIECLRRSVLGMMKVKWMTDSYEEGQADMRVMMPNLIIDQ